MLQNKNLNNRKVGQFNVSDIYGHFWTQCKERVPEWIILQKKKKKEAKMCSIYVLTTKTIASADASFFFHV